MNHYILSIRVDGTEPAAHGAIVLVRDNLTSLVGDMGGQYIVTGHTVCGHASHRPNDHLFTVDAGFDNYVDAQRAASVMLRFARSHLGGVVGSAGAVQVGTVAAADR